MSIWELARGASRSAAGGPARFGTERESGRILSLFPPAELPVPSVPRIISPDGRELLVNVTVLSAKRQGFVAFNSFASVQREGSDWAGVDESTT